MCLICVEYYYNRMTRNELKKALPEMIMFAKNEEERIHYKILQGLENDDELDKEVAKHLTQIDNKNVSSKK